MRFRCVSVALGVLIFIFMAAVPLWAAEEIGEVVVTASRVAEPVQEATSDVIVISAKELEMSGAEFLPDALKSIPELNVIQSGGTGTVASVFLRGGSPKHTVVLIDGIRVNDTATGEFDFSGLSVDDIERVEIVKGPQGTMYGSDAMAGVINIITKKGRAGFNVDASFEGGSFATYNPALSVSGGMGGMDYRLTGSYFKTDGISVAASGSEDDGYENISFSGKLGYAISKTADIELNGRYLTGSVSLDGFDFTTGLAADDPNYTEEKNQYLASVKGRAYLREDWEQVLNVSTVQDKLIGKDPDTSFNNYEIETGKNTVDWQNNIYAGPNVLTVGADYRTESGKNTDPLSGTVNFDESVENVAAYASTKVKREDLTLSGGVRYDVHDTAGEKFTWRVGASEYRKDSGLTFRASYGTGFRAPALNELFFPFYGNIDLKPEETTSWEVGLEKELSSVGLSVTYFNQNYENLIDTDPNTFTAANIKEAAIQGVETGLSYRLSDALGLKAGYTYLDTEDKSTGDRLQRRPRDKATAGVAYSGESLSLSADALYVGERFDAAVDRDLDSYYTVNLGGGFRLTQGLSLTARVENLMDEKYEEAGGYGTPGRAFYGGVKATF